MALHYKFKNAAQDFALIACEGNSMLSGVAKRMIAEKTKLPSALDYDLRLTNAQTREEYKGDNTPIPRNTSLIVQRVPATRSRPLVAPVASTVGGGGGDANGAITSRSRQHTATRRAASVPDHPPPASYVCFKCDQPGHWIAACPLGANPGKVEPPRVKKATGIPRAFLKTVATASDADDDAAAAPPDGVLQYGSQFVKFTANDGALNALKSMVTATTAMSFAQDGAVGGLGGGSGGGGGCAYCHAPDHDAADCPRHPSKRSRSSHDWRGGGGPRGGYGGRDGHYAPRRHQPPPPPPPHSHAPPPRHESDSIDLTAPPRPKTDIRNRLGR